MEVDVNVDFESPMSRRWIELALTLVRSATPVTNEGEIEKAGFVGALGRTMNATTGDLVGSATVVGVLAKFGARACFLVAHFAREPEAEAEVTPDAAFRMVADVLSQEGMPVDIPPV